MGGHLQMLPQGLRLQGQKDTSFENRWKGEKANSEMALGLQQITKTACRNLNLSYLLCFLTYLLLPHSQTNEDHFAELYSVYVSFEFGGFFTVIWQGYEAFLSSVYERNCNCLYFSLVRNAGVIGALWEFFFCWLNVLNVERACETWGSCHSYTFTCPSRHYTSAGLSENRFERKVDQAVGDRTGQD